MTHYTKAVELLAHGEPSGNYELYHGNQNALLLAALTHAVLALSDAVRPRRGRRPLAPCRCEEAS